MIRLKNTTTTTKKTTAKKTTRRKTTTKEVGRLVWLLIFGLVLLANTQKLKAQTITPSATVLDGFSTNQGVASSTQSVNITSTGLTADITITVPSNFEISVDGGANFVTSTTTTVTTTNTTFTVQVRVAASSLRGMRSETLAFSSTGATANITLRSVVIPASTITLVSQLLDNASPIGIGSQRFPDLGITVFSADDFTVPAGQNWRIQEISTRGSKGTDPINQIMVRIWTANATTGLPDGIFHEETLTAVNGQDDPHLTLSLSAPLAIPAGTYWLSVVTILPSNGGRGSWFWRRTTNGTGDEFHFRDPNDFFGLGATNWTPGTTVDNRGGKQLIFNIAGTNDLIAPTVSSVTVPANATYIAGQNLDFTVNFSENVNVVTTGGTPQLAITIGSTTRQATYVSGSGSNALLFRYTIQTGETDNDDIVVGALAANGGTLRDAATNNANLTLNSIGANTAVLVDAVAPTGYTVNIDQSPINAGNDNAVSFTFTGAEVGATYNYTFTSSGGAGSVTGTGTIATATDQITGIDLTGLTDGTITLSVTLTDVNGNAGSAATDTETKDTEAPTGYTVSFNQSTLNAGNVSMASITFTGAEIGATFRATFSSNGGAGSVGKPGTVTAATQRVSGLFLFIPDGVITVSFTLTDVNGNTGSPVTATVIKDVVAPTVTSVAVPINLTYRSAFDLNFRVSFSENITVVTTGGTPQLAITIGSTVRQATYRSGSGTGTLLFRYTVQAGELDTDGITVGALAANGGTLRDAAGNDAVLMLNSVGSTTGVLVDSENPTVTSITRQSPTGSPTNSNGLTFRVIFSEDVESIDINGNDFVVTGPTGITITVLGLGASYDVIISGGNMATFSGTVTLGFSGSQDIADENSNPLVNTMPTGTNVNTYVLDNTAPTVTSFTRKTPNTQITNADAITFLATFSEDVQNVDLNDFAVTGPTGATIMVTQLTASTYDVQISGGDLAALNGTVGLNLAGGASVTDLVGNALTIAEPGTDETYSLDNSVPNTVSFTRKNPATTTTSADQLTFLATFSEDVTGVGIADFTTTGTTASIASVTQVTASTYDVVVSGGDLAALNGTVGLNFAAGVAITDLAGNTLPNVEPGTDQTYTLCNGPDNPVTGVSLGTVTANSIVFTGFTASAGGATGYVVKINNTNTFTPPTDGATLPTANLTWVGAGEQVIYTGTSANPNITVTGLTSGITYYFKIFAYNDCGGTNAFESAGAETNTATPKADQIITFGALAKRTFGDAPFNLNATASSGLAVTYVSSNTAVATVSGNTVTIVGVGTTNITASQAGNTNFNAAPDVTQPFTVNKADQTITFNALADQLIGSSPFDLTATASSGLTVTYQSSNTAVATVSGNTVTVVGVGTTNITASQAGDANYNAAPDLVQPFTVINAPIMGIAQGSNALPPGTGNYNFGAVDAGQSSNAITFTIANSGTTDLQLSGSPIVALSGTNSNEFTITQPTSTTVAPAGNATFQVVFAPTTAGTKTATVSIANNSATHPYTFTLTGEGIFGDNNLAAPNLFTPNGDGRNDAFLISAPTLATVTLKIYNRKGTVVFSSSDVNEVTQNGWNGELNRKKLPTGTYIWQITGTYQDGTAVQRQTGEVYLVR